MNLAVWAWSAFLCGSVAVAENCPKYALRDKEIVRNQFTSQGSGRGFYVSAGSGVTEILTRMANIAYVSSGTGAILSSSDDQRGQRAALDAEYQALISTIDEFAENRAVSMSPRTRMFLRQIVNSKYLELNGTTVTGTDEEEAGRNADAAINKVGVAMERLWRCF